MKTLWTPPDSARQIDLENPFNMATVYNDVINQLDDPDARIQKAQEAFAVIVFPDYLKDAQITVVAESATFQSTGEEGGLLFTDRKIGLNGTFEGFSFRNYGQIVGISVVLDALYIFPVDKPEQTDLLLTAAYVMISNVLFYRL